jgi:hypothetical protein
VNLDEDAVIACADLVGRTGAANFQIGYLHDGVPADQAGWYAHAQYRGGRITVEDQPGPSEAADALARRLLVGGECTHCHGVIILSSALQEVFADAVMTDGRERTGQQRAAAPRCRWRRMGAEWKRGCA